MLEYSTEAIVLEKEPIGEIDTLIFLYTPHQGKVVARAKSARKITSKLAASLEPANLISARILSHGTHQIVDAISLDRASVWRSSLDALKSLLHFLRSVKELAPEGEPLTGMWDEMKNIFSRADVSLANSYDALLKSAGFDARGARCEECQISRPDYFIPKETFFVCRKCRKITMDHSDHIAIVFQ